MQVIRLQLTSAADRSSQAVDSQRPSEREVSAADSWTDVGRNAMAERTKSSDNKMGTTDGKETNTHNDENVVELNYISPYLGT